MNTKNFLWIAPFLSFAFGYLLIQKFVRISEIITPALVGQQVHTILPLITQCNLNIRLIDQKEESEIPEGIILNQTPVAGTAVKPNQPIFIVTTKKPITLHTPQCIGLQKDELIAQLTAQGIQPRIYYLSHPYPEKMCFAQSPQYNESLEQNKLTLYISAGNNKPIIWPDFIDLPLQDVIDFLDNYHIEPHIINDYAHMQYTGIHYKVIDQRPFAGTLLTLDETKPLSVQLRIRPGE
jgi:beta-lactam-binding protein with PASTA domain